jgi:DNA-binding transcriptional LysR family regulator
MQNRLDFRWDDARVLLALLETRTLSGTALKLGVNTSTIGRRLDALESAVGARLFDRTAEGVLPTALAEQLAPHAEALERSAASFAMAAQGREVKVEGEVRITAPPGIADFILAPALPRLLARWPDLRITILASIGYVDLARREADIAMRILQPAPGDLVARKLGEPEEIPLASPEYAEQLGTLRTIEAAHWIGWGEDLAHIPSARWLASAVPRNKWVLCTSSVGTQIGAAESGLGLVVLSKIFCKSRRLVPVKMAHQLKAALPPAPRGAMWLVGHRALRDVPRIAAVWSFIEQEAQRLVS